MPDWINDAASDILSEWPAWEAEAGQLAQSAQDADVGERHMLECIANKIRWLYANHSSIRDMRKALEPFAEQARIIDANDEIHRKDGKREDFYLFRFDGSYAAISLGDCRRAVEALK